MCSLVLALILGAHLLKVLVVVPCKVTGWVSKSGVAGVEVRPVAQVILAGAWA
jgi:hypothetical protein